MASEFYSSPDDQDAFGDAILPLDPAAAHGTLQNGMQYFVRYAAKPKGRLALALAVNVGSVAEEDHEQGVAHILEHLAFNATESYTNHDIVRFLESIGAEFGACQNAHTSFDETVYELLLPTEDLAKGLSVFAEFASKIRCDPEDLRKERGAVLDEWRGTRSVEGRASEGDFRFMCKGCKYADRLPIGLESVIRNVSAATVRGFYDRWYRPENMAVIVAGDIQDSAAVVAQIRTAMEPCRAHTQAPPPQIPRILLPAYSEPRFHAWVDREQQGASVQAVFLREAPPLRTPADLRDAITEELFITALNNRLHRISRRDNPPFYAAAMSNGAITRTIQSAALAAAVEENGHLRGLEVLLTELARVRCHGFSEHELAAARNQQMAEVASSYRERDQVYGAELREEYVRHFLSGELVVGREKEARLTKTMLPQITAAQVLQVADQFRPSCSCCIKAASHRKAISVQVLRAVVERVERQEREGQIPAWDEVASTAAVIPPDEAPEPGSVSSSQQWPYVGATEIRLENGMTVCYKRTDFLGDQVLVTGSAHGGLSEVSREQFRTCSQASRLASEIGQFGHPPEGLAEMLMGKRVEVNLSCSAYARSFAGEQSPLDLETAFQLIYRLFTHQISPNDGDLATCLKYLREAIVSEIRNPMKLFFDRVRFINHNCNYFYEPMTLEEVDQMDPQLACDYFNDCFRNPAQFTVCVTGSIEEETFLPLVERYLASIPSAEQPAVLQPERITALPNGFPDGMVVEDVRTTTVAPQGLALITIPITLAFCDSLVDQGSIYTVMFCCQLLEQKLLRLLRFRFGEVYSVVAGVAWRTAPSGTEQYLGELSITFTCDPSSSPRLVEMALAVFERLQGEACSREDIDTLLSIEKQDWESQQEENYWWQTTLTSAYSSRYYRKTQDVDATIKRRDAAREEMRSKASPELLLEGYRTYFPYPVRSRHTAITFSPRLPLQLRLLSVLPDTKQKAALWTSGALAAVLGAFWVFRWLQRRR